MTDQKKEVENKPYTGAYYSGSNLYTYVEIKGLSENLMILDRKLDKLNNDVQNLYKKLDKLNNDAQNLYKKLDKLNEYDIQFTYINNNIHDLTNLFNNVFKNNYDRILPTVRTNCDNISSNRPWYAHRKKRMYK